MSGEYKISKQKVEDALEEATASSHMSKEAMLDAFLNSVLAKMVANQSRADILSRIEFLIDSQDREFAVITRGC